MAKDLITLVTPTGHRPEAFALCEQWMQRQTIWSTHPIEWVVVGDSEVKCTQGQRFIKSPVTWAEGVNTQKDNLKAAIPYINGKYVLFIEDDDYYSPKYLESMVFLLERFVLVGESNSKYYHVDIPGWKQMQNYWHSSLCQTGIRKEVLFHVDNALASENIYVDIELWKSIREAHLPHILFADKQLSIGIKGMPGRKGIGIGHDRKDYFIDPKSVKLEGWIGEDIELYRPFLAKNIIKKTSNEIQKTSGIQEGSSQDLQKTGSTRSTSRRNTGLQNPKSNTRRKEAESETP